MRLLPGWAEELGQQQAVIERHVPSQFTSAYQAPFELEEGEEDPFPLNYAPMRQARLPGRKPGRVMSPEHRAKISASLRARYRKAARGAT